MIINIIPMIVDMDRFSLQITFLICCMIICYYNIKYTMFGWLSRCWGGMGVSSQFQKARLRSVIADEKVPDDTDVCVLINSFKGVNPQIEPENAFNMFFSHLEMSQQKSDPLFLLKHLYILDHTVQEQIALNKIATYYCSQFQIFKQGSSIQFNSLRQLVATYFLYIKKKAEVYEQIDPAYFSPRKQDRQVIIQGLTFTQTFWLIDKCFSIQKCVNQINIKYKYNKSSEIIKVIFTMLFKTYLFCYTLVSISAKVLFGKLKKLNKSEASRFYKFIKYYNNQYIRSFVQFRESNEQIYEFKNFKYSQLIRINQCYIQYLQKYIYQLQNKPLSLNSSQTINYQQQNRVSQLPQAVFLSLKQSIRITYQPRKIFKLQPIDQQLQQQFLEYTNVYSKTYESQLESSKRQDYNEQLVSSGGTQEPAMTPSKLAFTASKRNQFEETVKSSKFNQQIWKDWKNVYSS